MLFVHTQHRFRDIFYKEWQHCDVHLMNYFQVEICCLKCFNSSLVLLLEETIFMKIIDDLGRLTEQSSAQVSCSCHSNIDVDMMTLNCSA